MPKKILISIFAIFQIVFLFADISHAKLQKMTGTLESFTERGMFFVRLNSMDGTQSLFLGAVYEVEADNCLMSVLDSESPIEIVGYFTNLDGQLALDLGRDYLCSSLSSENNQSCPNSENLLGTYIVESSDFIGRAIIQPADNMEQLFIAITTEGAGICDYDGNCKQEGSNLVCDGDVIITILPNALEIPYIEGYCGMGGYTMGTYKKSL